MPVSEEFRQQYLKAVQGTDEEKAQKRKAINKIDINTVTKEEFVKQATPQVKANDACPPNWFMCAGGFCAPSKEDCS